MDDCIQRISEYLGCQPNQEGITEPDKVKYFRFDAAGLTYEIFLNLEEKQFFISANLPPAAGADSLFEVTAPFDRISVGTEPHCYEDQKILLFRKDYPDRPNFKTLMIIKWPSGKLSIWPSSCVLDVPASWTG